MMKNFIFVLLTLVMTSCWTRDRFSEAYYPSDPVAFDAVNSIFDDINSDISRWYIMDDNLVLTFSSKRGFQSTSFSFYAYLISPSWSKETGRLNVHASHMREVENFLIPINNACNQKGPYFVDNRESGKMLIYSSDCDGSYKLYFKKEGSQHTQSNKDNLGQLRLFNEANVHEMYASFFGEGLEKEEFFKDGKQPEKMIFTSDKDGVFDIYEMDMPVDKDIMDFLTGSENGQIKKLSINSEANDHYPFVMGNYLFFASDRAGGFGGYDLYVSKYSNGEWSAPRNLGGQINSEYDELRPILNGSTWEIYHQKFNNRLMIFSSDRPGGKGGFDLYYVGFSDF
ncbi:MAG: TolB family protein [Cecembia sp.]